jgi:hypothetical protein
MWVPMRAAGAHFFNSWAMKGELPRVAMRSSTLACHQSVHVDLVIFFREDERVQKRVYFKTSGILGGWVGERPLDDGSLATKCPHCGGDTKTEGRSIGQMRAAVCKSQGAACWRRNRIERPAWIEVLAELPNRTLVYEVEFPLRPVYEAILP